MKIRVNGELMTVDSGSTLQALLDTLAMGGGRLAVEVNETIVPRSEHASLELQDGDTIEIVHAIGGG